MEDAPETKPIDQPPQPPPKIGKKRKDQSTGSSTRKKTKAQKTPVVYTLINDNMHRIGYQLRDVTEEVLKDTTKKNEELQMKVQDQCLRLQQLLEIV
jgi:hypothetical protein